VFGSLISFQAPFFVWTVLKPIDKNVIASINQESLKKNEMTCFAVNERYLPLKTGQITHPV
jgi:hypothetical protein